jgi:hypothetical protein
MIRQPMFSTVGRFGRWVINVQQRVAAKRRLELRMHDEPKIMSRIAKLLEQLDAPARSRVIGWTISALDVQVPKPGSGGAAANRSGVASVQLDTSTVAPREKLSAAAEDWLVNEQDYTI